MKTISLPEKIQLETVALDSTSVRYGIRENAPKPEKIYRLFNPDGNETVGFVAIDNLSRGPGLGGIRLAPGVTLWEVCGLASAMTLKSAAALLPLGGAKSGLIGDPRSLSPSDKAELIARVAEAFWQIPEYIPGPDMGTDEVDMQRVYNVFSKNHGRAHHGRGAIGRPPATGGFPIDDWGITAHGLFAAAQAAEKHLPDFRIAGARAIVQGFGNVGHAIAEKLAAAGARIVGASDITGAVYQPEGLDLNELSAARRRPDGLAGYRGRIQTRFDPGTLDRLLERSCDLLIPAARPNAIHEINVTQIQAKLILQGANNPVRSICEHYLYKKGIVNLSDFIVNAGGVIAGAVELKADMDPDFDRTVRSDGASGRLFLERLVSRIIGENVAEVFDRQKKSGSKLNWRDAAVQLAKERLNSEKTRVIPELAR